MTLEESRKRFCSKAVLVKNRILFPFKIIYTKIGSTEILLFCNVERLVEKYVKLANNINLIKHQCCDVRVIVFEYCAGSLIGKESIINIIVLRFRNYTLNLFLSM